MRTRPWLGSWERAGSREPFHFWVERDLSRAQVRDVGLTSEVGISISVPPAHLSRPVGRVNEMKEDFYYFRAGVLRNLAM